MEQQIFSNFSQYGKNAIDSTKELVAINGRFVTKVLDNQIQFANTVMGSSIKEIDASATKDPAAFIQHQSSLLEEYSEIFKAQAQTSAKVFQEAGEELKTWFEKGVKTADTAVKKASEAVNREVAAAPVAAKKPATKKASAKPAKKAAPKKAAAKKSAPKATAKKAAA